jgi:hypothetical protein
MMLGFVKHDALPVLADDGWEPAEEESESEDEVGWERAEEAGADDEEGAAPAEAGDEGEEI